MVKSLTNQIKKYLKTGNVSEAAMLGIVSISAYDYDMVGVKRGFRKGKSVTVF